jgi:ketosteroid isomerase-like protein
VLAVDEARGLIAVRLFEDLPAVGSGYPLSYQVVQLLRFEDGKIARVEAFTSELPYGMKPH